jgi:hypothetical protein
VATTVAAPWAWYRFDEDGVNTVVDASGGGREPRQVPGERTRHALVDAVEHLLAELRGPGRLGYSPALPARRLV